MKKLFVFLVTFFAFVNTFAQEVQIQSSKRAHKFSIEHIEMIGEHYIYLYGEIGTGFVQSSYVQSFYEYPILKNIKAHVECRFSSTASSICNSSIIVGPSFRILNKNYCYASIAALYRYDDSHLWQASATYGFNYKNLFFDGYCDVYGADYADVYSENKLKLRFGKYFAGTNIEWGSFIEQMFVTPYVLFGVKF